MEIWFLSIFEQIAIGHKVQYTRSSLLILWFTEAQPTNSILKLAKKNVPSHFANNELLQLIWYLGNHE